MEIQEYTEDLDTEFEEVDDSFEAYSPYEWSE